MDKTTRFFFLFEQSGTFKKQALRLGFDRSSISPCFASQFLRSYVIPREFWEGFDFYGQ